MHIKLTAYKIDWCKEAQGLYFAAPQIWQKLADLSDVLIGSFKNDLVCAVTFWNDLDGTKM